MAQVAPTNPSSSISITTEPLQLKIPLAVAVPWRSRRIWRRYVIVRNEIKQLLDRYEQSVSRSISINREGIKATLMLKLAELEKIREDLPGWYFNERERMVCEAWRHDMNYVTSKAKTRITT